MATNKFISKYPEIKELLDRLRGGEPSVLLILFVPSHTTLNGKSEHLQTDQIRFADEAMAVFVDLYDGATLFRNLRGIYQSKEMKKKGVKPDHDEPIMIQSLAEKSDVLKEESLVKLAEFIHNMGGVMRQRSIGLIVDNKYIDCVMQPQVEP